jgi:integrase
MPLNDSSVKAAKPSAKPRKLFDEKRLFLLVAPNGSKLWRIKYRFAGKDQLLSLGAYPEVSLKQAREKRQKIREQVAAGIDPSAARKAASAALAGEGSFEALAREWHRQFSPGWTAEHAGRIWRRLESDLIPWLGKRPVNALEAPELLACLRRIQARGALESAHRGLQTLSQIFRYAVATGRALRDPTADLRGALPPARVTHFAAITDPKVIGVLLRDLDGYQGSFTVRCALQLAPLLFVRPGELRQAEWEEFDLTAMEWRIPAHKMKMRFQHIVPLSRQALAILADLRALTGHGQYLFPGLRTAARPMSENTINAALRRLGYDQSQMTGHGFRTVASTLLNEMGWHRDAIERQLAHAEKDGTRAAYCRAEHLPERRRMMQAWSDYLDGLKQGGAVIPIRKTG